MLQVDRKDRTITFLINADEQKEFTDEVCCRRIGGGGPTPFLPMEKCVFPFFPMGKNGEKKYMERKGKVFISLSFHILFFPIFPHGKKWENTHFSMGKNGVGPPPELSHAFDLTLLVRL